MEGCIRDTLGLYDSQIDFLQLVIKNSTPKIYEVIVAQWHKYVTVNAVAVGSIPTRWLVTRQMKTN